MRTTVIIIGAGHAGLAMSRCLAERAIDHVVLERGEVANSWKTERWDSLRLLTPNWQSRLPGHRYEGNQPDGFRTMPETIAFIEDYAARIDAPVRPHTEVLSVRADDNGYTVGTNQGDWRCRAVVLASGACNIPHVPAYAGDLPAGIDALTPFDYRNPDRIEPGGVLVVGASATGLQLAEEIHQSGRSVTLSVGEHVRVPRSYRGRDIQWWMDATGVLDERYDRVDDIHRARGVPSLQLVGSNERRTLDLNTLSDAGVEIVGPMVGITNGRALFSGSLRNQCALADLKMDRLLDTIDTWINAKGDAGEVPPARRFTPTRVSDSPSLMRNLERDGIRTVVWATGFRPDYSWLQVPVLDRKGRVRHDGGVTGAPGLYVMGLQFLRRRKSALIDGAGDDARDLSAHLAAWLGRPTRTRQSVPAGAPSTTSFHGSRAYAS